MLSPPRVTVNRPFFQQALSRPGGSAARIDWTAEAEWRHVGDVDLSRLAGDAGLLFVPRAEEAEQLRRIRRWPIVVLPGGKS